MLRSPMTSSRAAPASERRGDRAAAERRRLCPDDDPLALGNVERPEAPDPGTMLRRSQLEARPRTSDATIEAVSTIPCRAVGRGA